MLKDVRLLDERVTKLRGHFTQTEKDLRDIETSAERITKRGERILDTELGEQEQPSLLPKL